MRPLATALIWAAATAAGAGEPEPQRPVMRELPRSAAFDAPPSQRDMAAARPEFQRRFHEPLARATTAAGANRAVETLLDAALVEENRALKWLMLTEARRLAAATGNALAVNQAVVLASASYDFDDVEAELKALAEIPLRALDPSRATALAEVAERLATRAETDRRLADAVAAQTIAVRAWQRAGNLAAAANAAARHDAFEAARGRKR